MLRWTKEKPTREGWYWVSDDPKTDENAGIYKYVPGCFGVITVMIRSNPNMFFAGPVVYPKG